MSGHYPGCADDDKASSSDDLGEAARTIETASISPTIR